MGVGPAYVRFKSTILCCLVLCHILVSHNVRAHIPFHFHLRIEDNSESINTDLLGTLQNLSRLQSFFHIGYAYL